VVLGNIGEQNLQMLQNVFGTELLVISRATVFQWWKHFKDGNKMVVENSPSKRPCTAVTDVILTKLNTSWMRTARISQYKS
jgi:hypothetical protein